MTLILAISVPSPGSRCDGSVVVGALEEDHRLDLLRLTRGSELLAAVGAVPLGWDLLVEEIGAWLLNTHTLGFESVNLV